MTASMTLSADSRDATGAAPDRILDLYRLRDAVVDDNPFPHVIVPGFVRAEALHGIHEDFPGFSEGGSFPVTSLDYGPRFASLVAALRSPALAAVVADKLAIDLAGRPTTITVRATTREKDGRIHTDSKTKLVTALVYMNAEWESGGGRLRLLRGPDDLEDYVAEVPPEAGTLLMFLNGPTAWHGHKPHVGPRRTVQLNWVTDAGTAAREEARHGLSARIKRLLSRA
ncbi:MAG: 2OG-Fe(II) oxygenase [Azospirillaceae bacterium]